VRKRYVVLLAAGLALAVPAGASAHGRGAAVALDYRLVLHASAKTVPGVTTSILDGDRSLRLEIARGSLVVLGDLGEPMIRLTPGGAWVNRASATAVAERLVPTGSGWQRVSSGSTFAWHEHRLSPPPYDGTMIGPAATFAIPVLANGHRTQITGTFVRYARPTVWPWLAAAVVTFVAIACTLRFRRDLRSGVTTTLGAVAGLAALTTLAAFGAADAPNGRVSWAPLVAAGVLAAVVYGLLVRLKGIRRVQLAGFLGLAAAVISLSYLSIFWHGVVISRLSGMTSRGLLVAGIVAGAVATVSAFTLEEHG